MHVRAACILQLLAAAALAHPVAQGAMDIAVHRDRIEVHARVSNEEALVAEAFGRKADPQTTLDEVRQRHGAYLLAHLHFSADGRALPGRLLHVTPPPSTAPDARIRCDFVFDLPAPPRAVGLRQDVLNEFTFAPGNPWEAAYIVRLAQEDGPAQEGLLLTRREPLVFPCDWTAPVPQAAPRLDRRAMALAFVRHGVAHILGGYDHLLFVSGLVLAVASFWDLVKVVSAFTLAHTLTLTLAVLDIFRLPGRIVEPMIAASIVFVAVQNILAPARSRGWTRLAVAFGFGLFHGLGFAGGLLAAMEGMAGVAIVTAIAAFSLGVEIGHQLVALPLFGVVRFLRSCNRRAADPERIPRRILRAGSCAIGAAGLCYLAAALR